MADAASTVNEPIVDQTSGHRPPAPVRRSPAAARGPGLLAALILSSSPSPAKPWASPRRAAGLVQAPRLARRAAAPRSSRIPSPGRRDHCQEPERLAGVQPRRVPRPGRPRVAELRARDRGRRAARPGHAADPGGRRQRGRRLLRAVDGRGAAARREPRLGLAAGARRRRVAWPPPRSRSSASRPIGPACSGRSTRRPADGSECGRQDDGRLVARPLRLRRRGRRRWERWWAVDISAPSPADRPAPSPA